MKHILFTLGLTVISTFSFAMEKADYTSSNQSPEVRWKKTKSDNYLKTYTYTALKDEVIEQISFSHRKFSEPTFSLQLTTKAALKSAGQISNFHEGILDFSKKNKLSFLGSMDIKYTDGEEVIHEALRMIHNHIPFTEEMVKEICQFMGVGNPFVINEVPQLLEQWFIDIDASYKTNETLDKDSGDFLAEQQELADKLYAEVMQRIEEKQQEAPHMNMNEFIYPLAEKCEAKYGIDDYLTVLFYNRMIENNPQDYALKKKMAHLTLANGLPRKDAIEIGTIPHYPSLLATY